MHMCYCMGMATAPQPITSRTVVLLRPEERRHLEQLAASEHVSAGEVIRRSLSAYEKQSSATEQEALAAMLAEMNTALDGALSAVRSARSEIRENLRKIEEMQKARP